VLTNEAVTLCWLGDSRAYWLGAGPDAASQRLTRDDSVAGEMVAAGLLSEADALAWPQAHVVTGWVGADLSGAAPHVTRFEPPGPGALLLCSDGLWNYQPEAVKLAGQALPEALSDPLAAASALVGFALESGGMDNVTVVLAPFPLRPARTAAVADSAAAADPPADFPADPADHTESHEPTAPSDWPDPQEKPADEPA
jgi:serine/threonine protein phosphatase PrpC